MNESEYAALFESVNETASTLALFDNQSGVVQRVGLPAALPALPVAGQRLKTCRTAHRQCVACFMGVCILNFLCRVQQGNTQIGVHNGVTGSVIVNVRIVIKYSIIIMTKRLMISLKKCIDGVKTR